MKISDRIQLMALKWDSSKEPSVEPVKEDAKQPDEKPKTEAKEKVFNIEAMKEWWQSVKRPSDQRHR